MISSTKQADRVIGQKSVYNVCHTANISIWKVRKIQLHESQELEIEDDVLSINLIWFNFYGKIAPHIQKQMLLI